MSKSWNILRATLEYSFHFIRKETVCCPLLYEIIYKFRYESLKRISQAIIENKCPPIFQNDNSRVYYLHIYGGYTYAYQSCITCSTICPLCTVVSPNIHIGNSICEGFTNTDTRHKLMLANLLTSLQSTSAHFK